MGIAAYGPRNPVPPTLATRGSLLRGHGNRGYELLPKSPRAGEDALARLELFSLARLDLAASAAQESRLGVCQTEQY